MSDLNELMTTWVRGWVAARALSAPEDLGDGLRVECRQPGRDVEIFGVHAEDDPASVARLAVHALNGQDIVWLTAATTRPEHLAGVLRGSGLSVLRDNESLMTTDLRAHPRYQEPPSYRLHVETRDAAVHVEIRADDGDLAARGAIGLTGTHAVPDRILTSPAHRRRGLANAVMSALVVGAAERGATAGILIASEDGQRLYPRLGWSCAGTVLISAAPGAVYPA